MTRIGLLSDTHGFLDPKILKHFEQCDEIWHAGDFGTAEVSAQLENFKPLRGVYGNIDGHEIRKIHPLDNRFQLEGFDIWMRHIGGYPNRYDRALRPLITANSPQIFVCGHSHILKIVKDPKFNNMLVLNPGAAGKQGLHKIRTILRFALDNGRIENMQAIELSG